MSEQRLFGDLKQELFLVLPHYTWSWQFGLCSPEWLFLWAHTCICVSCLSSSQLFVLGLAYCDWRDRLDWVVCLSLPSQLAWAFLHDGNSFQEWRSGNSCGQGSDWHYIISATFFWSKEITWPAHIQGLRKWSPPLMEVAAKYCGHFLSPFTVACWNRADGRNWGQSEGDGTGRIKGILEIGFDRWSSVDGEGQTYLRGSWGLSYYENWTFINWNRKAKAADEHRVLSMYSLTTDPGLYFLSEIAFFYNHFFPQGRAYFKTHWLRSSSKGCSSNLNSKASYSVSDSEPRPKSM